MKIILLLLMGIQIGLASTGQTMHLNNDKYVGNYKVIYFSDSLAYNNLVSEYPIRYNERNGCCDTCEFLSITDTSFIFEIENTSGDTNYRYWGRKKKGNSITISFYPSLSP
ncbi:MAG TPA: hypothetical protein VGO58_10865, partial [Chitinophagaceae bacterium]|nr:hypothetical protein [Chitinophagaceae bacterium]